jgi:hypothetical protein
MHALLKTTVARIAVAALVIPVCIAGPRPAAAQENPPAYGSLAGYPLPAGEGSGAELEFCYRYSKRVWEIVKGQPRNMASLEKLKPYIKQGLGSLGAAEDIADLEKYFSGDYKSSEEMAGLRFYNCAQRLKLPVEERHKNAVAYCFQALVLPSRVAALKSSGQPEEQVLAELKAFNPYAAHPAIESTVRRIYAKTSEAEVDRFIKDTFLGCIVRLGENEGGK